MSEHDNGWEFAKRLSDALLKVRPLGGSELFVKRNNQYYADPDYCGRLVEELLADNIKETKMRFRLERQLREAGIKT
jgi:hypothetical protein